MTRSALGLQRKARKWASKNRRPVEEFYDSAEYARLIANDDELWNQPDTKETEYPKRIGLVHTDL